MNFEASAEYVATSAFRFMDRNATLEVMRDVYSRIARGEFCDVAQFRKRSELLV